MARRKKGKNDFGEDLVLCPECKSERVHTAAVSRYYVNTGDHFCHSAKTHDSDSPAGCCDCDWEGIRADLYLEDGHEI